MIEASPWIEARAAATPRALALLADETRHTYASLREAARARARRLRALGVRPGDGVALLLGNGSAFAELLHAVDLLGAILVPLNVRLSAREIAYPLRDSGARLLVHGEGVLAETARRAALSLPRVHRVDVAETAGETAGPGADAGQPGPVADSDTRDRARDPLAIVYTSGTSGRPKGAVLTRDNFLWSAVASAFRLGVVPGDRWLACMPLFHVGGLSILLRSALQGTTALVHPRFDAARVSRALDEEGVTLVSLTATMLDRLLSVRGDRPAPPGLRCVLLGGGPCPARLHARAAALGFALAPSYGLTEAASQVATRAPSREAAPDAGLTPLLGTRVKVVDERGEVRPAGEPGEILVCGPSVMRGYHGRPEESAAALRDGWLRTGDVGLLDRDGDLHVLERRTDLIVSGGENVYPAEVEAALTEHPAVSEAGVAGVPDREFGARPAAWLVLQEGVPPPTLEELRAFCRERLAGYKIPVCFRTRAALPRNASGKLLRRELEGGRALSASGTARPSPAPSR